jgi:hypothetical protein
MTLASKLRDSLGIVVGAIGLLIAAVVLLHERNQVESVERLEYERLSLVATMQFQLSKAAEAEKSAVMAITDAESQAFADQARTASDALEQSQQKLHVLMESAGKQHEIELLAQFSQAFDEYQRIEKLILDLAVQNSNLKAFDLAFGPAFESIHEMDQALTSLLEESAHSTDSKAHQVMLLAARADAGALRIHARLAPHIAEKTDERMDELEASIKKEEELVRESLEDLAPLMAADEISRLQKARDSYARYDELKTRILDLSRQNTNVQSTTTSLNEMRLAFLKCQDILIALEQVIRRELRSGRPVESPRGM